MGSRNRRRIRAFRHVVLIAGLIAAVWVGFVGFEEYLKSSNTIRARFVSPSGVATPDLVLEIANTDPLRHKGLMYRKAGELAANEGMLFIFPQEKVQSFWMKNTFISLDMIFINQDREVVGILSNVPILQERSFSVPHPSTYVVEVLAGSAKRWNLESGWKFDPDGALPQAQ